MKLLTLSQVNFLKNQAHAHEILSCYQDPIGVRIGHGSQVKLTARCKSSTFIAALLSSIETKYHGHWALHRLSSNDLSYLHFYSSTSRVRSRAVESSFIYSIIFIILCRLSLISCYNCTFSLKLGSEESSWVAGWVVGGRWVDVETLSAIVLFWPHWKLPALFICDPASWVLAWYLRTFCGF